MFKNLLCLFSIGSVLFFSSCRQSVLPEAQNPRSQRAENPDNALLAELQALWLQLRKPNPSAQLVAQYNAKLLEFLRRMRYDYAQCKEKGIVYKPVGFKILVQSHFMQEGIKWADVFDDVVPAVDVKINDLEEHYKDAGLGVPMVGIVPAENTTLVGSDFAINGKGTTRTLTAIMSFKVGQKPSLRFIARKAQNQVRLGRNTYNLAADHSAAIELYWDMTGVKKWRFLGLIYPQELREDTGLSCMEQYDPDRIPVILSHGLASSPNTFSQLLNRLVQDEEIRENFQFWYFGYPTGVAWALSAQAQRQNLQEIRKQLHPRGKRGNWDKLVLVGHSMGGLITHLNQSEESWKLLTDSLSSQQKTQIEQHGYLAPDKVNHSEESRRLHKVFNFKPIEASRVVYLATPHKGAPMADYLVVRWLRKLIELPADIVKEAFYVATLHDGSLLFNPKTIVAWFTSVDQLSPDSASIKALATMKLRSVPTHSVIGDRGKGDTPDSSDGVVPYWSSHLGWGSELIVPSDHSVQDDPKTAVELMRILKLHLQQARSKGFRTKQKKQRVLVFS